MYHESNGWMSPPYYDTKEEMPDTATVKFPDGTTRQMTAEEITSLDNEGWFTVMHSVNWGSCDHWTSEKPSKWVRKEFQSIIKYVNEKKKTVGFNRSSWTIVLTKDAHFFKSAVWNS